MRTVFKLQSEQPNNSCLPMEWPRTRVTVQSIRLDVSAVPRDILENCQFSVACIGILKKWVLMAAEDCLSSRVDALASESEGNQA